MKSWCSEIQSDSFRIQLCNARTQNGGDHGISFSEPSQTCSKRQDRYRLHRDKKESLGVISGSASQSVKVGRRLWVRDSDAIGLSVDFFAFWRKMPMKFVYWASFFQEMFTISLSTCFNIWSLRGYFDRADSRNSEPKYSRIFCWCCNSWHHNSQMRLQPKHRFKSALTVNWWLETGLER
jgi:hypothetical protein